MFGFPAGTNDVRRRRPGTTSLSRRHTRRCTRRRATNTHARLLRETEGFIPSPGKQPLQRVKRAHCSSTVINFSLCTFEQKGNTLSRGWLLFTVSFHRRTAIPITFPPREKVTFESHSGRSLRNPFWIIPRMKITQLANVARVRTRIESTARGRNIVLSISSRVIGCPWNDVCRDTGSDACEYSHAGVVYLNSKGNTVPSRWNQLSVENARTFSINETCCTFNTWEWQLSTYRHVSLKLETVSKRGCARLKVFLAQPVAPCMLDENTPKKKWFTKLNVDRWFSSRFVDFNYVLPGFKSTRPEWIDSRNRRGYGRQCTIDVVPTRTALSAAAPRDWRRRRCRSPRNVRRDASRGRVSIICNATRIDVGAPYPDNPTFRSL